MAIRVATMGSLLMVLFAISAPAGGQENERAPEQLGGESADIAGDHALLADYFRAMSVAARSRSRFYDVMANSSDSGEKRAQLVARHYEKLVEQYRAVAEEYDALAILHDEEASEAR